MCGIAGVLGCNTSKSAVERMVTDMVHRGPDDAGIFSDEGISMGMTRLSILDLSDQGHQPMQSHCGRYWIVYNGECYNYKEIREKLERLGERFISNSDTEVVLQSYVKWGSKCLDKMNGMFAFAIWDTENQILFAARDRFGIKPFYYQINGTQFIFASEIKAMLRSGFVDLNLSPEAIRQYFTFGHVVQPLTVLKSVMALMPGHFMFIRNGDVQIDSYWTLNKSKFTGSYADGRDFLRHQIGKSVKSQLISDRKLGLFLSGGLDSAVLLSNMTQSNGAPNTFSIGFEENPFLNSEEKYASDLAKYFGANHHQVNLTGNLIRDELENYFTAIDQPTIDGLNTFFVSKHAVREMTVALNGLGGDELFAGYGRHARALWKSQYLPQWKKMAGGVAHFLSTSFTDPGIYSFLQKVVYHGEGKNPLRNYMLSRVLFFPDTVDFLQTMSNDDENWNSFYSRQMTHFHDLEEESFLDRTLNFEMQGFMSSMILRDSDPVSMHHSLEVRFPYIDHDLVELVYSFPESFKIDSNSVRFSGPEGIQSYNQSGIKKILMESYASDLPPNFGDRPKVGFKIPINFWLRTDWRDIAIQLFNNSDLEGYKYLDQQKVIQKMNKFYTSEGNDFGLWAILVFLGNVESLKKSVFHIDE